MNPNSHFLPQQPVPAVPPRPSKAEHGNWLADAMTMLSNEEGGDSSSRCTNQAPRQTNKRAASSFECQVRGVDAVLLNVSNRSLGEDDDLLAFEREMNLTNGSLGSEFASSDLAGAMAGDGLLMFTGPEVFDFDDEDVDKGKADKDNKEKKCDDKKGKVSEVDKRDSGSGKGVDFDLVKQWFESKAEQPPTPREEAQGQHQQAQAELFGQESLSLLDLAAADLPLPQRDPAPSRPSPPPHSSAPVLQAPPTTVASAAASSPSPPTLASIQLEIEAQAERVRRSFLEAKGRKSRKGAGGAKRRRISGGFGESASAIEGMMLPGQDQQSGGGRNKRSSLIKKRTDGRPIFQSGLRNYFRGCSSASESDAVGAAAGSNSSTDPGASAPNCAGPFDKSAKFGGGRRGSIRDLVAPVSALLSDMQRRSIMSGSSSPSDSCVTLNRPGSPNAIAVTKNDVICGNGPLTDTLIGNKRYQVLIELHARSYAKAPNPEDRIEVARSVVNTVRSSVPSGRFLQLDVLSGMWVKASEDAAVDRADRSLREAACLNSSGEKQVEEAMRPAMVAVEEQKKCRRAETQMSSGRALAA